MDLVSPIRAQNTLLNNLGASVNDRTTWLEANFPWSSDAARRQWASNGALANVDARFQIAREDACAAGDHQPKRPESGTFLARAVSVLRLACE